MVYIGIVSVLLGSLFVGVAVFTLVRFADVNWNVESANDIHSRLVRWLFRMKPVPPTIRDWLGYDVKIGDRVMTVINAEVGEFTIEEIRYDGWVWGSDMVIPYVTGTNKKNFVNGNFIELIKSKK